MIEIGPNLAHTLQALFACMALGVIWLCILR